jgi:hypothetical protein
MAVVAVADIRNSGESARKTSPHLIPSLHPATPWLGTPRHLQNAVLDEETHHRIDVMRVERLEELLEHRGRDPLG